MDRDDSPGPLEGIRVIDCSTIIAGPACARYLADLGADVIKVERPDTGDTTRSMGWRDPADGVTFWWKLAGRNKRSVALDLKSEPGWTKMLKLCDTADVLVENFRPGTLERLGLGPKVLHGRNPRLVMVRITGYGQDGPYASRPGFASLAEAMSGFAAINGEPDGPPLLSPIALTDEVAGLAGAFAALAALRTGRGQVIDVSLWESLYQLMGPLPAAWEKLGYLQPRLGAGIPFSVPRGTYRTADGRWVAISTSAESVAERVMELVGLGGDKRVATFSGRAAHREEVDAAVARWIGARPVAEVMAEFGRVDAAAAPVMTMEDIASDPHAAAREMTVQVDGVAMQNVLARLSATPGRIRWAGRPLGGDTDEVLAELGAAGSDRPPAGPWPLDVVDRYLARIDWPGERPPPTGTALAALHEAHSLAVPFENLSIHQGMVPSVAAEDLLTKLVDQRRGGICFELNGGFGLLMSSLGFDVEWMEGRVWDGSGWSVRFDHMCLRVEAPTGGVWLADVGFGDGFLRPLPLELETEADDPAGAHRLVAGDEPGTLIVERRREGDWERRYRFSPQPVALDDFVVGCQYHATSPRSPFTVATIASVRQPDGGRRTLAGRKWIVTSADGEQEEREVSEEEAHDLLHQELGLDVEGFRPVG